MFGRESGTGSNPGIGIIGDSDGYASVEKEVGVRLDRHTINRESVVTGSGCGRANGKFSEWGCQVDLKGRWKFRD